MRKHRNYDALFNAAHEALRDRRLAEQARADSIAAAERKVIEAAEAWFEALPLQQSYRKQDALEQAVHALRAAREAQHGS